MGRVQKSRALPLRISPTDLDRHRHWIGGEPFVGNACTRPGELAADGPTRQADLKERLGKPSSHVSTYKKRLLEAGAIEETRRGVLRFALPGLREYLRSKHLSS